jgi:hypothetical protein
MWMLVLEDHALSDAIHGSWGLVWWPLRVVCTLPSLCQFHTWGCRTTMQRWTLRKLDVREDLTAPLAGALWAVALDIFLAWER